MLGAYAGYTIFKVSGNFWLALLTAPVICGLLGALVERGLLKRIYTSKNPLFSGVLVTYGLSICIPDLIRFLYGRPGKPFPIPRYLQQGFLKIGNTDIGEYRIFVVVVTAVLVPALWYLLNRTNLGMIIRAGSADNLMVQALGINVSRIWTITFAVGIGLAGFAGVVVAPLIAVVPEMGAAILIQNFIVVVVGGMGTFAGAIAGGLMIGEVLTLTGLVYDTLGDVIIYVLMAIVLLVRPRGLFGQEGVFEK
jgi:branched-chain amino acid transport system permease protein